MPLQLVALLLFTPLAQPFRWSRLALTCLVPPIPLLVCFDGTMSKLRMHLMDELRELVASVPGSESYTWEVGTTPIQGIRGLPRRSRTSSGSRNPHAELGAVAVVDGRTHSHASGNITPISTHRAMPSADCFAAMVFPRGPKTIRLSRPLTGRPTSSPTPW